MGEDRMEEMERRLQRLERQGSTVERARRGMDDVMPRETRQHIRNAGREQLLAVRTMLDHWIRRLGADAPEEEKPSRETIHIE